MRNDSVRAESKPRAMPALVSKPADPAKEAESERSGIVREQKPMRMAAAASSQVALPPSKPIVARAESVTAETAGSTQPAVTPSANRRVETGSLTAAKTSKTLVGFDSRATTLPDWRLEMQNAVQKRRGTSTNPERGPAVVPPAAREVKTTPAETSKVSDPRVVAAMRRIEASRNEFLASRKVVAKTVAAKPAPTRPFELVPQNLRAVDHGKPIPSRVVAKPELVTPSATAFKVDTNKLPRLDEIVGLRVEPVAKPIAVIATRAAGDDRPLLADVNSIRIQIETMETEELETSEVASEEIDDLAPISMRFGAGLFDFIIGGVVSIAALSPVLFSSGAAANMGGWLTVVGAFALINFVYMTACLSFFGKTFGMRLFSLEMVDASENEYPTIKQAAISSSVFILALPLAGAGFLPVLFNEENRALHDLLSGTILVREF